MKAIVTVCDKRYKILLPHWLKRVKAVTDLPVVVLALEGAGINATSGCEIIKVSSAGNPFPPDLPDHACAEKLRVYKHLPESISEILFLDLDVLVLNDFWNVKDYFSLCREAFIASLDLFVGYKEKMEEEFRVYDPSFRMKFLPDGNYLYFNTGVFFASREKHEAAFAKVVDVWVDYVGATAHYPSIFDQNIFNYCMIVFGMEVMPMPIQNNCLRQYPKVIDSGRLLLNGSEVNAVHFNGGDAEIKLTRWLEFEKELGDSDAKVPHA